VQAELGVAADVQLQLHGAALADFQRGDLDRPRAFQVQRGGR
jgi:hypothetical protein